MFAASLTRKDQAMADDWEPGPALRAALTRLDAGEVDAVKAPRRDEIIRWAAARRYLVIVVADDDDPAVIIQPGDGGVDDLPATMRP